MFNDKIVEENHVIGQIVLKILTYYHMDTREKKHSTKKETKEVNYRNAEQDGIQIVDSI